MDIDARFSKFLKIDRTNQFVHGTDARLGRVAVVIGTRFCGWTGSRASAKHLGLSRKPGMVTHRFDRP